MTIRVERARSGLLLMLLVGVASGGCDHESGAEMRDDSAVVTDAGEDAGSGGERSCDDKAEGEACGAGQYCIRGSCQAGRCGDGVRTGAEACDDANEEPGDGCDPDCQLEPPRCGNAELDSGEECDDGNLLEQDGCSNHCTLNECGNERVDFDEECDDANDADDDTCSNMCKVVACRNGRLDPGEECDDGNAVDEDGCTNECKIVLCGNGKVEKYESCDDGNLLEGDGCPGNCISSVCGNGIVERGEACERPGIAITKNPDGTSTGRYRGCGADCKRWLNEDEDPCFACQRDAEMGCRNYQGVNVLDGCFLAVYGEFGADTADPTFIQHCLEVVDCALSNQCWLDPLLKGSGCYCGSATADQCNEVGPAADAPCRGEWERAARTEQNVEVQARFSDFTYPSSWAYFMLECYQTSCKNVCTPKMPPAE